MSNSIQGPIGDERDEQGSSSTQANADKIEQQQGPAKPSNGTNGAQSEAKESDHLHHLPQRWSFWARLPKLPQWRTFAEYCPLVAAILAPTTTVLDIPALTQHWYELDGVPQPDPKASLALSALGLGLNVIANILLIIRFSSRSKKWWSGATKISLLAWIGKTLVAFANLLTFGILTRNAVGYVFQQAFWCAVVSIIGSGIICLMLLLHYFFIFKHRNDKAELRMEGRRFMLSVTVFMGIMTIQALVFSQIEGWSYLDGIYFSVETALTIGFGDLVPTTTAGKVLVFVFSVLTISQLGNEIAIIISFISSRADQRRERWRRHYEGAMHREAYDLKPRTNLLEEMALVHEIQQREEMMDQIYDLVWSAASLVLFWLVGAAIFSSLEGWTYGNTIYMVMILSLTIGFGDFTPKTPAGRVVFVVYALMAVPIVTSFAVQTITGLLSTYSERGATRDKFRQAWHTAPETFTSHAEFVNKARKLMDEVKDVFGGPTQEQDRKDVTGRVDQLLADWDAENERGPKASGGNGDAEVSESRHEGEAVDEEALEGDELALRLVDSPGGYDENENGGETKEPRHSGKSESGSNGHVKIQSKASEHPKSNEQPPMNTMREAKKLDDDLVRRLLDLVVSFEADARQLLISNLDDNVSRTLLLADRNVQVRDMIAISGKRAGESHDDEGDEDGDDSTLAKVRKYRRTFAEILVIGSTLQKLEGSEKKLFERWQDWSPEHDREHDMEEYRKDLDKIANDNFNGITSRIVRRHAREQQRNIKRAQTVG